MKKVYNFFITNFILMLALLSIVICVLLIVFVYSELNYHNYTVNNIFKDARDNGVLGDFVNGITAPVIMTCMALLTFLAFYVQFQFNKKQLDFNNNQLTSQSFFELFKMHVDSVSNLKISFSYNKLRRSKIFEPNLKEGIVKGKEYFAALRYMLWEECLIACKKNESDKINLEEVISIYEQKIYEPYDSPLGYYYRNLYHLFKFITESKMPLDKQNLFFDLVRAQLSEDELFILHYNFEFKYGEKFKKMMEENAYDFFKHIGANEYIENYDFKDKRNEKDLNLSHVI